MSVSAFVTAYSPEQCISTPTGRCSQEQEGKKAVQEVL